MRKELQRSKELLTTVIQNKITGKEAVHSFGDLGLSDTVSWTDEEKIVFWVNVYNAQAQVLLKKEGERINKQIYSQPMVQFKEIKLSLDAIEHGILRRGKWKKGLGYVPAYLGLRPYFLKKKEPRIHFLLNCAAESCPIIRVMELDTLSETLEQAEKDFVEQTTDINEKTNEVKVSALFLFYRGDFNGRKGIKKLIGKYLSGSINSIKYKRFSWKPRFGKVNY